MNDEEHAACADLPFEEGERLFFSPSVGGGLRRTSRWPRPDSHADARAVCASCPLVESCLGEALQQDEFTFRVLSPEERAAFGGVREKHHRHKAPALSRDEVWNRVLGSNLPAIRVLSALLDHDRLLLRGDSAHVGVWVAGVGWSADTTKHALPHPIGAVGHVGVLGVVDEHRVNGGS